MSVRGKLASELASLIDKQVTVKTTLGDIFTGKVVAIEFPEFHVCLADVIDGNGEKHPRVIIRGEVIAEIFRKEKPFDLKGLAERLEKLFPNMVKYYEEARVITIMDRVRVTEQGVVEGTGLVADKVKKVYDAYVEELKEKA
ncbi:MAG: Lsm family RNA-binding protein [Candidatus Methanomethylicia archaeon]